MPLPFFEPRNKRTGEYPTPRVKTSKVKTIQTTLSNPGKRPELIVVEKYSISNVL